MAVRDVIPSEQVPQTPLPAWGLLAAATIVDDPNLGRGDGFTYQPRPCPQGGATYLSCNDYGSTSIGGDTDDDEIDGDPILVWANDACSGKMWNARDPISRAQAKLAAIESYELAAELWDGTIGQTAGWASNISLTDLSSDRLTTTAVAADVALGRIEGGLAHYLKGGRGMVHVTPQVLVALVAAQAVVKVGNAWYTPMGHVVVADAGYSGNGPAAVAGGTPAGSTQYIYGTSMIGVRRGPVEVFPGTREEAFNPFNNRYEVTATRVLAFVFATDCAHVAAEVNITIPTIGGTS